MNIHFPYYRGNALECSDCGEIFDDLKEDDDNEMPPCPRCGHWGYSVIMVAGDMGGEA